MKPVQYFSDNYLESCKKMTPLQICRFLEDFRKLQEKKEPSVLISLKVPEILLKEFRSRCQRDGLKYQTQIKQLMKNWLQKF